MSLSTSLRCPHCGYSAQSSKPVASGAKVRCTRCNAVFRVATNDRGPTRSIRAANPLEAERLQVLFDSEDGTPTPLPGRDNEIGFRVQSDSEERLAPRSGERAATTIKKPALDGKPLPFHGPRAMFAAALLTVVGLVGFGAIRWYMDTVVSLDAATTKAAANRKAAIKSFVDTHSTKALKAGNTLTKNTAIRQPGTVAPGATVSESTRTIAPRTEQIGHLVVGVFEAQLTNDDAAGGKGHLTVTLRVTNRSAVPMKFASWSDPVCKVILTDQYNNYYNRTGPAQAEQVIEPNQTIVDALEFEKPLPGAVLALDLPTGSQNFQFSMPAAFVQRAQTTRIAGNIFALPPTAARAPAPAPVPTPAQATSSVSEQPYSPERNPQIIGDVNAAYKEAMKRVEKRTLGMTTNNAARFRKTEKDRIVKALAEKMEMTVDQISHMLSSP